MQEELSRIRKSAEEEIASVSSLDALEALRIAYFGREKGALNVILRSLKDVPESDRRGLGEEANRLRGEIASWLKEKKRELEQGMRESVLEKEWIDVTLPGMRPTRGHLHPVTKVEREIMDIFTRMGFAVVEGPEVESEYYNFDALNIPANHPAREMWDTFWLRGNVAASAPTARTQKKSERLLLRTHTSPVQVRYMETHNPPIRIIVPGRAYRYEATDASHDFQFHQVEGLFVDKGVSVASFKAIIGEFFSRLFKAEVKIRLRPSYFPFTEPSFEVDISCISCKGRGCPVCKHGGWLELAGAGMVHPYVFKAAGYNPKDVQGFAFGMGVDRLVLMKYHISDIRLLRSGDLRFLHQF